MKPVRLPASATNALPRWGVLALGLLYIFSGLIGRDPWKNDDAASFGIMWSMAHGNINDWLVPHIAGLPMPGESPLAYWIGAVCIRLFGQLLGDPMAARLSAVICFSIASLSIWYATYLLGCRGEAQPLRLAFGGQPEPKDFGRTLADGAFLIYLGCLGLLVQSHQTTAKALQIALVAYAIYGAICLFESRNVRHAMMLGISLGFLILTRGWVIPLSVLSGLLILAVLREKSIAGYLLLITLPVTAMTASTWVLATYALLPEIMSRFVVWGTVNLQQLSWPSWEGLAYYFKYGIWFAWPAWPFAGWALYAWRKQRTALHIALPLTFFVSMTLAILLNPHPEEGILLPLLPPLVILAAFGLPTMKRGAINAVDWFSVMTFTTIAAFIWFTWIAKEFGWPVQLSKNVYRLAPGFKPDLDIIAIIIAILGTVCWLLLVHWRLSRQPAVLWRAVVLSSGGVILCWLLLTTIWMPWINYSKSYAGVAQQIEHHLPAVKQCVETNIGPAQRASFAYFGAIPFAEYGQQNCDFLLYQDSPANQTDTMKAQFPGSWKLLWTGRRPADRDERFRLYKHIDH